MLRVVAPAERKPHRPGPKALGSELRLGPSRAWSEPGLGPSCAWVRDALGSELRLGPSPATAPTRRTGTRHVAWRRQPHTCTGWVPGIRENLDLGLDPWRGHLRSCRRTYRRQRPPGGYRRGSDIGRAGGRAWSRPMTGTPSGIGTGNASAAGRCRSPGLSCPGSRPGDPSSPRSGSARCVTRRSGPRSGPGQPERRSWSASAAAVGRPEEAE